MKAFNKFWLKHLRSDEFGYMHPLTPLGRIIYIVVYVLDPVWFLLFTITGIIIILLLIRLIVWISTGRNIMADYFDRGVGG